MKNLLCVILLLSTRCLATNYYFSNTGSNSNNGTSTVTPFQTLAKISLLSINPGDSFLLNRGDVFYEKFPVAYSGSSGSYIGINGYGVGQNPIVSGWVITAGWSSVVGNISEYINPALGGSVAVLAIDGAVMPMGRYPNVGYNTISSHSANSSITDPALSGSPDFSGGEVVIRKTHWIIDRCLITNHSSGTVTYTGGSSYNPIDGYGYFLQNNPSCLDTFGEWCYNSTTHKISMYFGGSNPSAFTIKASRDDTLITINNRNYLSFNNIDFQGANTVSYIENAHHISFNNCNFTQCFNAVRGYDAAYVSVTGGSLENILNNAIHLKPNCDHATVTTTINNTGLIAGMGKSGDDTYQAIIVSGDTNNIVLNTITNSGYIPIRFEGTGVTIDENYIDRFCITKDDGAGVYTYEDPSGSARIVSNNVVLNGVGAPIGTDGNSQDFGIYIDDNGQNVNVYNNTVSNCTAGVYLHNAQNISLANNHLFNNGIQILLSHDGYGNTFSGLSIKNNVFFSQNISQLNFQITTPLSDFATYGTIDSNYYCRPSNENDLIKTSINGVSTFYNLSQWKVASLKDASSNSTPSATGRYSRLVFNATSALKTINLDISYKDVGGSTYSSEAAIPPFSSIILISANINIGGRASGKKAKLLP